MATVPTDPEPAEQPVPAPYGHEDIEAAALSLEVMPTGGEADAILANVRDALGLVDVAGSAERDAALAHISSEVRRLAHGRKVALDD